LGLENTSTFFCQPYSITTGLLNNTCNCITAFFIGEIRVLVTCLTKGKRDFNCTGIFREGIEQLNWDFNEGKGRKIEFEVGETYNVLMQTLSQQNVHYSNMYSCLLLILT